MKKLLTRTFITLFTGTITTFAFGQNCQVTASASTQNVCLGSQVTISAIASANLPSDHFFNFNQNQLPPGWATTGTAYFQSTLCVPHPNGSPYYWAQTTPSGALPQIITSDLDICSGGYLEFDMRFAIQGDGSPCEGPDEQDEGVSIEYSLNGGGTWVEFIYYRPDGTVLTANPMVGGAIASGNTPLTTWGTYTVPIPAGAISTSTRFRWIQKISSTPAGSFDNWGLDDIGVYAGPCLTTNLVWSNGMTGVGNFTFTPTTDTCFTASLYDDNNNFLCSDDICITVNPLYAVDFDTTICTGETVFFGPNSSALLPYTSAGSYPVTFTAATGCDSVVTLNLSVTPPANDTLDAVVCFGDTYTVGSTVYNASGMFTQTFPLASGCDSLFTLNLTVKPEISTDITAGICQGDTYTLGTQTLSTAGTYQEIFTATDGCDSTVTLDLTVYPIYVGNVDTALCPGTPFHYGGHTFVGAGSYPVQFQTVNGCDSSITLTITDLPGPAPSAGNDLTLCSDEVGNLGGPAIPGASYSWTGGADLSDDTLANPTVSVHSLVPITNTYVVTANLQGCTGTDTVEVSIVPYPVVNLQAVVPQCFDGNLFDFTAGSTFLPGATYDWNMANATPATGSTQQASGVHFLTSGNQQTILTVYHGTCATSDTLDVMVHAEPQASMQALPTSGCVPLLVQFQNTSVPAAVNSFWNLGNGQTSTNNSPSTTYTQDGSYTVSLVVVTAEGCVDSVTYPQVITVYPLPEAGFTAHPTEVFMDNPVVFVTDNSMGASTWDYSVTGGSDANVPSFSFYASDTGLYYIQQTVTSQHGCTDVFEQVIHVSPATTFYIPNAFTPGNTDGINGMFGAYGNEVDEFRMTIYDRWGQLVFQSQDMEERWDGTWKGKLMKQDVYVYRLTYLDHHAIEQEIHGHVVLIR